MGYGVKKALICLLSFYTAQRIGPGCRAQIFVVHVRVNLCCVQMLMAQDFLESTYIYAILEHQGGRSVPQLVAGVQRGVQTGFFQPLLDHIMNRISGHSGVLAG